MSIEFKSGRAALPLLTGLTADLAREIRRKHGKRYARATRSEKSLILNELTTRYGLSRIMVRELLRGKTWK